MKALYLIPSASTNMKIKEFNQTIFIKSILVVLHQTIENDK